jgi:hypothetical protein
LDGAARRRRDGHVSRSAGRRHGRHYAAILKDKSSGQQFAVDGWLLARGEPPEIVEVEKWYVDDSDILIGKTTTVTAANTP